MNARWAAVLAHLGWWIAAVAVRVPSWRGSRRVDGAP